MSDSVKFLISAFIALLIPILPFVIIGELPGDKWLSSSDHNAYAFAALGSLLLASDIFLPVPSSIVGSMLGARLGFGFGFLSAWLGLTSGSIIGYGIGLLWPRKTTLKDRIAEAPTMSVLFLSRPVPVLAEAVSFMAGANRLPFFHFVFFCGLGNAIYAFVLALNGEVAVYSTLVGPGLVLPMLLPVAAWLIWQWASRNKS